MASVSIMELGSFHAIPKFSHFPAGGDNLKPCVDLLNNNIVKKGDEVHHAVNAFQRKPKPSEPYKRIMKHLKNLFCELEIKVQIGCMGNIGQADVATFLLKLLTDKQLKQQVLYAIERLFFGNIDDRPYVKGVLLLLLKRLIGSPKTFECVLKFLMKLNFNDVETIATLIAVYVISAQKSRQIILKCLQSYGLYDPRGILPECLQIWKKEMKEKCTTKSKPNYNEICFLIKKWMYHWMQTLLYHRYNVVEPQELFISTIQNCNTSSRTVKNLLQNWKDRSSVTSSSARSTSHTSKSCLTALQQEKQHEESRQYGENCLFNDLKRSVNEGDDKVFQPSLANMSPIEGLNYFCEVYAHRKHEGKIACILKRAQSCLSDLQIHSEATSIDPKMDYFTLRESQPHKPHQPDLSSSLNGNCISPILSFTKYFYLGSTLPW